MTVSIDLPADLERRVRSEAERRGLELHAYLRSVIESSLPSAFDVEVQKKLNEPTLRLLAQWEAEDATDDPEEIARGEAELAEFQRNMNQNRLDADGPNARVPYP